MHHPRRPLGQGSRFALDKLIGFTPERVTDFAGISSGKIILSMDRNERTEKELTH
jgi:hypothetical protein